MNKRFKELAKQAGLQQTKWADADTEDERVRIWQESLNNPGSLEKFAELIVRECVGVVEGGRFLHDQAPTALFAKECSSAIKQHFGVEL